MLPSGEGEIFSEPWAAVVQASTPQSAEELIARLEASGIPAMRDRDLPGHWVGRSERVLVLVPSHLRIDAERVLGARPERPPPPKAFVGPDWSAVEPTDVSVPIPEAIELPEASARVRSWWPGAALAAVAIGLAIQVAFDRIGGLDSSTAMLAATSTAWDEPYRWLTAGFVHGSDAHAIGNALFAIVISWATFQTHGLGATAFVWLVSSAAGILAQTWLHPGVMVLGASAGNFGLLGLWAHGQWQRARRRLLPRRDRLVVLGVLLLLLPGALTPFTTRGEPVAVWAHVIGFAVGAAGGWVFPRHATGDERSRYVRRSARAGAIAVVLCMAAFATGLGKLVGT